MKLRLTEDSLHDSDNQKGEKIEIWRRTWFDSYANNLRKYGGVCLRYGMRGKCIVDISDHYLSYQDNVGYKRGLQLTCMKPFNKTRNVILIYDSKF